jgi:hypothetical protein
MQHGAKSRAAQATNVQSTLEQLIGGSVNQSLKNFSESCLAFAKVADGCVQEVQSMWYQLEEKGGYKLAVSANNSGHAKDAVTAIEKGVVTVKGTKGYGGKAAVTTAKSKLTSDFEVLLKAATLVGGCSHAEQNLLRWIACTCSPVPVVNVEP